MKIRIRLLTAVSAFTVVAPAYGQQTLPAGPNRQPGVWAQDYTGRAADPQVRFGRLANGLRYAIQHNDTPKNAVSVRMLIGSGSLSERDEERGLAHYLEHMAFRGSANVRDGETVRMLERLGLRFGADTNAGTSFDHTVYQFDFPNADATSLPTGLMLFREIGGRLRIDEATVDAERGVILSEERLRASGALKALEAQTALTLAGTKVPERFPIGTIDSIKAATAMRIRRFYEANYRPENATIVVVGAVDPTAVEAQLKETFANWKGVGPADPHVASPPNVGAIIAKTYVGPGAIDQLSLTWTRPLDGRADTVAREKDQIARILALTVLNLRLREKSQAPGAPFSVASAHANESFGVAEQTTITAIPAPGKWREAAAALIDEQRRLARDGIGAPDVARVIALTRPGIKAAADAAATRTDAVIIDGLVQSALDDSVYTSPGQDMESFDKNAAAATPESLTEAYRRSFMGVGPLTFRSSTDATSGDDAALTAVVRQAFAAPLAASVVTANVEWPYVSFGAPGRVIGRSMVDGSGITIVRFANGTRLAVKPTAFVAGGASVRVSFGEGIVGMHPDRPGSQWLLAFGAPAWLQGGTKRLPWTQMQRALEGHNVSVSLAMRDTDFLMSGETRKGELPFQLQLLAAYYADAAYRPDAVERIKGLISAQLAAINGNTLAVMSRALGPITHNGDTRWKPIPNDDDVAAGTAADVPALLKKATAMPADVVVVGDVSVDDAIASVAGTFGALSPAPMPRASLYKVHVAPIPPSGAPIIVTHTGRVDQAVNVQLWPTTDYYSAPTDSYALEVARALLSDRLVEIVREKLGLTYSPFASSVSDVDLPGNGYFLAGIEVPPEKFSQFQQLLNEELRALVASPITDDAIARAKRPIISARLKARETNAYWDSRVLKSLNDPRSTVYFRDEISGIEQVTASDIKRVLQRYIVGKKQISVEVTAKNRP